MAKKQGKTRRERATGTAKPKHAKAKAVQTSEVSASPPRKRLPNAWRLARSAAALLWSHCRLFTGIIIVYGLLNLLLVRGLAGGTDVSELKHEFNQLLTGHFGGIVSGLGVFVVLIGSAGNNSSQTAGAYQFFLAVITSLALIWALRQLLAGQRFRVRDAYYQGMRPLIPFILVMLVVALQLVPLLIGSGLYSTVITNGIAVHLIEKIIWALLFFLLALLSSYWLSSSLIALYIVTLPDMTPMKALRSARELVRGQRWAIIRKLICLPVLLLVAAAILMLPIIIWLTPLAQWIFFILTMASLAAIHAYMYTLYRELLNE